MADIQISTIVTSKQLDPRVELRWGSESGYFTPQEARAHALAILQASISIANRCGDRSIGDR